MFTGHLQPLLIAAAVGAMAFEHPDFGDPSDEAVRAIVSGIHRSTAAHCLCDEADLIRYANPAFRAAFFPVFDGRPADFMTTIVSAMKAGIGIRIDSASPEEFAAANRLRRQNLVGSHGFSAELLNGRWWTITDTRLPSGWILIVAQDISALKHEEARLRNAHETALAEAQTDFLTGIPNRRHGLRRAEALWEAARGRGVALALLDIDHFKAINDAHGHDAGDRALIHFSRHMMQVIAPEDQFSRLGGDEFMLVSAQGGRGRLETALNLILASMPNVLLPGQEDGVRLSISVGVARSRRGETWPGLKYRADMLLYEAKSVGRNRVETEGTPHANEGIQQ